MSDFGLALFDTAIGRCGIAWGPRGILAVQLPEADDDAVRRGLRRGRPRLEETEPPPAVRQVAHGIAALVEGGGADMTDAALDLGAVPPFDRRVYEVVRGIPPGDTLSYGEVAALAGAPGGARAVGQALGRNPFAVVVPCHRVIGAHGRVGGFSARGGVATKLRMLAAEGAAVSGLPGLYDAPPRVSASTSRSTSMHAEGASIGGQ